MKKISAILLALIMMLSMVAFASGDVEEPTATPVPDIEIDDTITDADGETTNGYTAWKLFSVEKVDDTHMTYYIVNNAANEALINELNTNQKAYVKLTASADGTRYTVEWANADAADDGTAVKAFAAEMEEFMSENYASSKIEWTGETHTVNDPGYYLIVSDLGTNLVLATTEIEIEEKNDYPTISKEVSPETQQIAEKVTYTVSVAIPETAVVNEVVIVHDTIEAGLAVDTTTVAAKLGDATVATSIPTVSGCSCSFHIQFTITEDMLGKSVTITYDAMVNADAEIYNAVKAGETEITKDVNTNTVYLEYVGFKSVEDTADVKTYEFSINKTDGTEKLTGAQFILLAKDEKGEKVAIDLYKVTDGNYRPALSTEEAVDYIEIGTAKIYGLDATTYYLREIKAPEGYNLLAEDVMVEIAADGTIKVDEKADTDTTFDIVNKTGSELPSTGGIGTTIFYTVGGLMMAAAIVLLVAKKKVAASK